MTQKPAGRRVAAVVGSTVIVLSMSGTLPARADDGKRDGGSGIDRVLPELRTPDKIKSKAIARGRITDKGTGNSAAGALVALEAWPSAADLGKVKMGETATVTTVAKAVTDKNGAYELKVENGEVLRPYVNERGVVDFVVVVHTKGGAAIGGAPVRVDTDGADRVEPVSDPLTGGAGSVVDVEAADPITPAEAATLAARGEAPRSIEGSSKWVKIRSLGLFDVQVDHIASTNKKISVDVTNNSGSWSTLGWGSSVKAATSGYSMGGTSEVKTVSNANYGTEAVPSGKSNFSVKYFRDMEYVLFQLHTESLFKPWGPVNQWRVTPSGYVGGGWRTRGHAVPGASKCSKSDTKTWTLSTQLATTFSAGVNSSPKIGIDMSSRSGRSSMQKIVFRNAAQGTQYQVCGTTDYPGRSNTGALVAK